MVLLLLSLVSHFLGPRMVVQLALFARFELRNMEISASLFNSLELACARVIELFTYRGGSGG